MHDSSSSHSPRLRLFLLPLLLVTLFAGGCRHVAVPSPSLNGDAATMARMNALAISYVRLALAVGEHDPDYIDAYYGPPQWRDTAHETVVPLDTLHTQIAALQGELASVQSSDAMSKLRHTYLQKQLVAMRTRVEMLQGKKFTFDEESRLLYDAEAPHHDAAYFDAILAELDRALPGSGALSDRVEAFRKQFVIPAERLDAVFRAAVEGCRTRTLAHVTLPATENFTIEYVTGKPWSGYNWYKGGYRSVIQVNTELPIFIDRAIDLACHEGYPGHHVYNLLLEKNLVNERGWVEFSVYPLFSPQSLIAEGSANYGIDVAFPGKERTEFEQTVLYPLAGLDASRASQFASVQSLVAKLSYAGNEAARRYLDGKADAAATREWLVRYSLMSPERAAQRLHFIEKYRSYVINYNLGKDLVAAFIERHGGTADQPRRRWELFTELLSSPRVPSTLD